MPSLNLVDAVAMLAREAFTGQTPPEAAKRMVDLWRPWVESRAGGDLSAVAAP